MEEESDETVGVRKQFTEGSGQARGTWKQKQLEGSVIGDR